MKKRKYQLRKYVVVVDRKDGSYATAMDVTDKPAPTLDRLLDGLYNRVDFDRFYVTTIRRKHAPEVRR